MLLLTLCGSLRARSSNRAILEAFACTAASRFIVETYGGLVNLPHFNPDDDNELRLSPAVVTLRQQVARADALIISTPEYAHALPGAFKNLLDWLVSDPVMIGKPVVILQAERGSTWASDSLREVLSTMSAKIVDAASRSLPLGSNQLDAAAILARDDLRGLLQSSADALAAALAEN